MSNQTIVKNMAVSKINPAFNQPANKETLEKTKAALEANGFSVILAENGEEARQKALELIPKGAEVMTMTSVSVDSIGLAKEINESGNYQSVRQKLTAMMGDKTKAREQKRLGAAPEYVTGSVHAVTEDGKILVASNTGSQLGAYIYGSDHVIWVAGIQKIVKDEDAGKKRIWEYVLPLESQRARKAYNLPNAFNSFPSKIVSFNRENTPKRITLILVNEVLGF
jgi:L-lactate utilization protein LutB